jgi:hypothetical protein
MQTEFKNIGENQLFTCESCGEILLERICYNTAAPIPYTGSLITFEPEELVTPVTIH